MPETDSCKARKKREGATKDGSEVRDDAQKSRSEGNKGISMGVRARRPRGDVKERKSLGDKSSEREKTLNRDPFLPQSPHSPAVL